MQQSVIEGFRPSRQQQRLWQRQQHDLSAAYRARCAVVIRGHLDQSILNAAIKNLFVRNEILRTTFHFLPGMSMPLQIVEDNARPRIEEYDLSALDPQSQEDKIENLFSESELLDAGHSANLALARLSESNHALIIDLPALCADARTLSNMVEELQLLYSAILRGEDIADEVFQYAQFSEWQNEFLKESDSEASRKFWQAHQSVTNTAQHLACEMCPSSKSIFSPKIFETVIAAETTSRINEIALKFGVRHETFLLSCWQALLWRLTRQSPIVVGNLFDGRNYEELQRAFGPFAQILPVSASFEEDTTFAQLLRQTEESLCSAAEWQDHFVSAQDDPFADGATEQPWQSFCFEYGSQDVIPNTDGPSFILYKRYACSDRFKIKLACFQQGDSLVVQLHYDPDFYRTQDVERLTRQLLALIESANTIPNAPVKALNMLCEAERQEVLFEFNDTNKQYPSDRLVFQLFEQQVDQTPEAVALVFEEQRLTYRELNERANQLAHYLRSRGVSPEVLVGLCVERSAEIIIGLLGILKAGGAYIPLEPALPRERLEFLLDNSQATMLITQQELLSSIPTERVPVVCVDSDWEAISSHSKENPNSEVSGSNAAYVIYTSGSTGTPKGVVVEHQQLLAYVQAIVDRLDLRDQASFALVSTFAADLGHTVTFPALCTGGCLHVFSQDRATDPQYLWNYFAHHAIDCVKIVPSHLSMLVASATGNLPLRHLILGGEISYYKLIERIHELAPQCRIYNHYGPTETTVGAVSGRVEKNGGDASSTVPLGRPIANVQVFILKDNLMPACIGEAGELYIGGHGVSRGYLKEPALTAEKFIPHPYGNEPGKRFYRTGDRARYLANGQIQFLDRVDQQVKIRGFRIELGEIESNLVQHEMVKEAVVILRRDEDADERLVAYVVGAHRQPLPSSELRTFLQSRLPDYMVPSTFVQLEQMPLTPNGKINRQDLPEPTQGERESNYVAPRTAVEEMLCGIWSEVLKIHEVGIHDKFFDLGGHSLLGTQVVTRVHEDFGVEISLRSFFNSQTVAELSEVVIQALLEADDVEEILDELEVA
jgi:amino acid adenylation domain-containing protein